MEEEFVITATPAQRAMGTGAGTASHRRAGSPQTARSSYRTCTTGLLGYAADPALADRHDGVDAGERIHPL